MKATATEVKLKLGTYLQKAMAEPVMIEKTHRTIAVLMSVEEYDRLRRLEDAYWGEKAKLAEAEGFLSEAETKKFIEESLLVKA